MSDAVTRVICPIFALLVVAGSTVGLRGADGESPSSDPPNVFDLPALQVQRAASMRLVAALLARKDYQRAEQALRQSIQRVPHDPNSHYNLACVLARQEKKEQALDALRQAVELGFRNLQHIQADDDLTSLRDDDQFQQIAKLAAEPLETKPEGWSYQVEPSETRDGVATVSESNTVWNARLGIFQTFFKFESEAADKPIAIELGSAGDLLRNWDQQGTAAGNHGDLYDNHDKDHSNMEYEKLPQLTRIEYSESARQRKLNNGLQLSFLYNAVTIGNSSTAVITPEIWRSQPRYALTRRNGPALLYLQHVKNHLYFYPEHHDHDPQADGGRGDLFPVNTPYLIISQGSSGSDRPFMSAVAATLAAFRPAVKRKLAESGALMSAVQMIFRSSNKMVRDPQDYLGGKAHPTVFDSKQLQVEKMVRLAHEMTLDSLPPMARLKVVEEDKPVLGRDYFDVRPRERLCDTPGAIGRVVKSTKHDRRMVVSAGGSQDLNGLPLTYHWVVLRGDADRIQINKLDEAGSQVELIVPHHRHRPIWRGSPMESSRVDIGVFAHNGKRYSAPAFVCFYYLPHEQRLYDAQHRILVIDYADPAFNKHYVDPLLDYAKDWRDEYHYDDDGSLLGWTRVRSTGRQEFTAEGELIVSGGSDGIKSTPVRYLAKQVPGGAATLEQITVPPAPQP